MTWYGRREKVTIGGTVNLQWRDRRNGGVCGNIKRGLDGRMEWVHGMERWAELTNLGRPGARRFGGRASGPMRARRPPTHGARPHAAEAPLLSPRGRSDAPHPPPSGVVAKWAISSRAAATRRLRHPHSRSSNGRWRGGASGFGLWRRWARLGLLGHRISPECRL